MRAGRKFSSLRDSYLSPVGCIYTVDEEMVASEISADKFSDEGCMLRLHQLDLGWVKRASPPPTCLSICHGYSNLGQCEELAQSQEAHG